jgi:hypothetical protein
VVTGERIGAVLAMQWEWGNLSSGDVSIPAEFHKGPSGGRAHPQWRCKQPRGN